MTVFDRLFRSPSWCFLRLLRGAAGNRALLVAGVLTILGSLAEGIGLLMLVPVLHLIGIGRGAHPQPSHLFWGLGLYMLLVAVAAVIVAIRTVRLQADRLAFVDRLRADLHEAVLRASWPAFQRLRSADILHSLTGDTARLAACHSQFMALLATVITVPLLLAVALALSPALTGMSLAISATAVLLLHRIGRSGFGLGVRIGEAASAMMADLSDDLAGWRTLKALGAEQSRAERLKARFADLRSLQLEQARIHAVEQGGLTWVAALIACGAILVAILALHLALPRALVIIMALARVSQRGLNSLRLWRQFEANLPSVLQYQTLLRRLRRAVEPPSPVASIPYLRRNLTLTGVGLDTPDGRRALTDVHLHMSFGTIVAVVGPSGAGKSTLADLAAGMLMPDIGHISVDDHALTPGDLAAWRRHVAVVPQDPFLFHDSIRANLMMAAPGADEVQLWTALDNAGLTGFVRSLPDGLDSPVGERGQAMSGGERQRLAIARALLRDPRLLILDEATSALDPASEAAIVQSLDRLRGRMIVLMITHRDAPLIIADQTVRLCMGRVVDQR